MHHSHEEFVALRASMFLWKALPIARSENDRDDPKLHR